LQAVQVVVVVTVAVEERVDLEHLSVVQHYH
jgi:hypothetical protein